jgi:hypothetical protein
MSDIITRSTRDDDELIDRSETKRLLGNVSTSSLYADPEVRALAIPLTEPGKRVKLVRWLRREILELRDQRIARARENSEAVRLDVIARNERRAEKRRQQRQAAPAQQLIDPDG